VTQKYTAKNLGRSAFWSVANQSLGQILSLAVFLVTARFVSKEAFGIMAMAMLAIEFFRQILIESVGTTFYARKEPTPAEYNAGFAIILTGGSFAAVLLLVCARPLADFFGHSDIAPALRWISALLLTTGLSKMHEVWLVKNLQFKILAIRSITSICIGGAVGITMAIHDYGIASLIAQQIVTAVISSAWLWASSTWRPNFDFKFSDVAAIVQQGKFVSFNSIASFLGGQGDVLLSSYYLGPAATGVYNAAKRLLTAISLIIGSGLNAVALPALASFSNDRARLQYSYLSCVGLAAFLTAPLFAGLSVLAPDLIHILMGEKWADAAPVLSILAVAGFNTSMMQYNFNIMMIQKKTHWITVICFAEAGTNLLLLITFAKYGLTSLAMAYVAKTLVLLPVVSTLALRLLGLNAMPYLRRVLPPIAIAVAMALCIEYLKHGLHMGAIANVALFVPVGAVIYAAVFGIVDRESLMTTLGFFQKVFRKTA
jgi:O-antigen/teichoic acid export membrane protein